MADRSTMPMMPTLRLPPSEYEVAQLVCHETLDLDAPDAGQAEADCSTRIWPFRRQGSGDRIFLQEFDEHSDEQQLQPVIPSPERLLLALQVRLTTECRPGQLPGESVEVDVDN